MYKYLLSLLLLVALSSCTMPWTKQDIGFQGLYRAHMAATIASLDEFGSHIGINRHESIAGTIMSSLSVPGIFSGALSTKYDGIIDGRNSESFLRDIVLNYTSLVGSGSFSADEIGLAGHGVDSYISYKNIDDAGMITDDMKAILKKYEGTWLSLIDTNSVDKDMTSAEEFSYNIARNLMKKSLSDVEKYATEYIIWKDTADLGMSGSFHIWNVELDRREIARLIQDIVLDLSGTGMTNEEIQSLTSSVDVLGFSGKLAFDPSDASVSELIGTLSASGQAVADISILRHSDKGSIRIDTLADKSSIVLNYGKTDTRYTVDAQVMQNNIEMGKISAYIERAGSKFRELSIEASSQGIAVGLKHTVDGDKFTGKLSAVIGTLEWSGTLGGDMMKSLKINGTSPIGSISAELSESGSLVYGPVSVIAEGETLFSANLGLQMAREKFAIVLDVLSESLPAHFDFDISAKTTPSNKELTPPKNSKSLQDMMNEIDVLSGIDSFSEEGIPQSLGDDLPELPSDAQ